MTAKWIGPEVDGDQITWFRFAMVIPIDHTQCWGTPPSHETVYFVEKNITK